MQEGVRVELEVSRPVRCDLADCVTEGAIRSVCRTPCEDGDGVVAEFVADGTVEGARKVFDYGEDAVYRLRRDGGRPCACEVVEALGYPIRDHHVGDGHLRVTFFAPDVTALRTAVDSLSTDGREVRIRRLTDAEETDVSSLVFVDRSTLTDRQREVLGTARRMGYFEYPKGANAGDVAAALDLSRATVTEHLAAAQCKVLGAVLE